MQAGAAADQLIHEFLYPPGFPRKQSWTRSPPWGKGRPLRLPWEIDHREPKEHLFYDLGKLGRRCDADQGANRPAPAQSSLPLATSSENP
jgi:hypothetical protein